MTTHVAPETSTDPWGGCFPLDPAFRDDPYPALARLRERDPVNETPLGIWRLLRHDDVVRLLHDVPTGTRTTDGVLPGVVEDDVNGRRNFMLQQDPPNHTRLRKLVSHAFTPRAINALRPEIDRIVGRCLDTVAAKGEMDVIADLALPVPSTVICEMMGVPLADRERFTVWTAQATHGLATLLNPPEVLEKARVAAFSLADYFLDLIAERRTRLTDDLLSTLIRAEEGGDRLSSDELISQSIGLLIAGFETTIGLIGNGVRALLQNPDQVAALRAEPGLIASTVEECLRYDGPITLTVRVLHADAEFGGKRLPCNAMVMAMLASANRDPAVFTDPERFDIRRTPNDHMAFGGGPHFCLGAHLARIEAQAAIGALVQRFDRLELCEERVEWGPSLFRVPGRLPIRCRAIA
jgi:cytochrome P450